MGARGGPQFLYEKKIVGVPHLKIPRKTLDTLTRGSRNGKKKRGKKSVTSCFENLVNPLGTRLRNSHAPVVGGKMDGKPSSLYR